MVTKKGSINVDPKALDRKQDTSSASLDRIILDKYRLQEESLMASMMLQERQDRQEAIPLKLKRFGDGEIVDVKEQAQNQMKKDETQPTGSKKSLIKLKHAYFDQNV